MVKYLAISLFLIWSKCLSAQSYYSKYQLQLDVTTNSEKSVILFRDIGAFYFEIDSIHNQTYLKSTFATYDQTFDSLIFFENNFEYFYCIDDTISCPDSEKASVLALFNKVTLEISDIKQVDILETKKVSIFEYISTPLQISDTLWMKNPPIRVESFYTQLCSHKINIYNDSQQLDYLISKLEIIQAEINSLINEDQLNYDSDYVYNEKLLKYIDKINNDCKVVIVSSCTD